MIVKCLFQLNGKTGFSKMNRKADLVNYLEEYGEDVLDALNKPLPSPGAMAAAAAAEAAADAAAAEAANDATAASAAANAESVESIDKEIAALLQRRRVAVAAAARAAARPTAVAPAETAAPQRE